MAVLASLQKYWAVFRIQVSNRLTYAADLASQSLTIVLFLWIFLQLWKVTYQSSGGGSIEGLTLSDTVWYLMMTESIILSKPRVSRTISEAVKDGSIAYLLNKPFSFPVYQASMALGDGLSVMLFNVLAGGTLTWLLVGPPPDPRGWPLTLVCVLAGWLIDFCISMMIGLAAFITEEVSAFEWIYSKILFLLGGLMIPLDFFPDWLQAIAKSLPFAYIMYGPARFFVDPTLDRLVGLLSGQLFWLLVLGSIVALLYRKSVSWLTINGG